MPVEVVAGDGPVILGLPHGGTWLPDAVHDRLDDNGRLLADTDWHIARLYEGLLSGATLVRATFHRYLIDANRDPADISLYPGQNTTSLCPVTDFDGLAIWRAGQEPSAEEILSRRGLYHAPYHAALADAAQRAVARHGAAIVYDCHSIRSVIPFLFSGTLPVFNIGTNEGRTCAPAVTEALLVPCERSGFPMVLNGRFKGGWTTRHYGQPAHGLHAIQMEIAQSVYLTAESAPWNFDPARAGRLRDVLGPILSALDHLARSGALSQ